MPRIKKSKPTKSVKNALNNTPVIEDESQMPVIILCKKEPTNRRQKDLTIDLTPDLTRLYVPHLSIDRTITRHFNIGNWKNIHRAFKKATLFRYTFGKVVNEELHVITDYISVRAVLKAGRDKYKLVVAEYSHYPLTDAIKNNIVRLAKKAFDVEVEVADYPIVPDNSDYEEIGKPRGVGNNNNNNNNNNQKDEEQEETLVSDE